MAFQIGDIVRLKSGGPEMTITGEEAAPGAPTAYRCSWIDRQGVPQERVYPEATLNALGGTKGAA